MTRPAAKTLLTYDEALSRVLAHATSLGEETVALSAARGRVLRRDVKADRDQPPFNRSAMDGFALRSGEFKAGATYPVTGGVAAGQAGFNELRDRAGVIRIATGAPMPESFDVVIPIELAQVSETGGGTGGDTGGEEKVSFNVDSIEPWRNIHRRAADTRAGDVVLRAGTRLGPHHLGIAAAVGATRLVVAQRPRITLLTSGDEVRPFDTPIDALEPQQIRNSNGPMLAAMLDAHGAPLLAHVHVPDEPEQTLAAAREALSQSHVVVTVGGVSAGQRDLLPWAWQKLGLATVLHGVAIQPGKPLLVCSDAQPLPPQGEGREGGTSKSASMIGSEQSRGNPTHAADSPIASKLIIGLPGNPVSVLATAHLFLWPALLRMSLGEDRETSLPWRSVTLAEPARGKAGRQVFRAAQLDAAGAARVIHWQGSGDLMHTAAADGFLRLPLSDDEAPAGSEVLFLPLIQ